nr:hypothetical protein [Tanacetum cinerariifolium]
TQGTHDREAGSSRSKRPRQHETVEEILLLQVHHKFLIWKGCSQDAKTRLHEVGSDEEIFTSVAWIRAFNINEPIYVELCHKFYSNNEFDQRTTGYDKIQKNDLWLLKDVVRSLSALIYYRDLDTTTLRDLIDSDRKLILEDPHSMQDLYDRMGRMEIHQEAIEHIEYRQSYHWSI